MAKTITEATEPLHLYGADWREEDAIKAGYFFVDMFGVKRGTRPASPDPATLACPITPAEKAAELAVEEADKKYQGALKAWQDAKWAPVGPLAYDYATNRFVQQGTEAMPATIKRLKEALDDAYDADTKARVRLTRIQAKRADDISKWNMAQVV